MAKNETSECKNKTGKSGKATSRKDTLRVALLIDESGSMGGMEPAVIAGVNEFINDLKADPPETTWTLASLAMFDARGGEPPVRIRFAEVPINKVRPIGLSEYRPHGATPLNDAVAITIRSIARDAKPKDRVMIVVLTDGLENASETNSAALRKLILKYEAKGWEFVYLGANQDTWAATAGIGLDKRGKHFAWNASSAGVSAALKVSGERVRRFREAPDEYRAESIDLDDRIVPGETKARRLTEAERRNARGQGS